MANSPDAPPRWLVLSSIAGRFMLDTEHVVSVFPISAVTPTPGMASWLSGLVRHSGRMFWLVDPAALLGMHSEAPRLAVRLATRDAEIALVVDAVETTDEMPPEAFAPAPVVWLTPCYSRGAPLYHLDVAGLVAGISPTLRALRVSVGPGPQGG